MSPKQRFRARDVQFERPDWEPALALLGPELTPWFQWMGELRLDDDTHVHVFQNTYTRRSIHISSDGRRTFFFDWDGTDTESEIDYVEHPPARAIRLTFACQSLDNLRASDRRQLFEDIDDATRRALLGEPFPVDPAELEAQRAFDARQAA